MPMQSPAKDEKVEQDSGTSPDKEGPEEVVLNVIRQMEKAKWADL